MPAELKVMAIFPLLSRHIIPPLPPALVSFSLLTIKEE
jgi:hypothetical protein